MQDEHALLHAQQAVEVPLKVVELGQHIDCQAGGEGSMVEAISRVQGIAASVMFQVSVISVAVPRHTGKHCMQVTTGWLLVAARRTHLRRPHGTAGRTTAAAGAHTHPASAPKRADGQLCLGNCTSARAATN